MEISSATSVNISNRTRLLELLSKLKPDTKAVFGMMTPQHMVEHLSLVLGYANGKGPHHLYFPPDKAEKVKALLIGTEREIQPGFKTPALPAGTLLPLKYIDLQTAVNMLMQDLDDFDHYFRQHSGAKPVNPIMGELTHAEWIIFHNKHFTHHFKQFNLL